MELLRVARVPARRMRRGGRLARLLLVLSMLVLPAVFALAERNELLALGYRIREARRECERLESKRRGLLAERAALQASARIEQEAGAKLGLVRPDARRIVYVTLEAPEK